MKIGTRSLLFGTHQFVFHPLMVALGWRHCYGCFPRDWRIWLAIIVHDWGYWGCSDMDGREGKGHPYHGAAIVWRRTGRDKQWFRFTAGHSRYYAKQLGIEPSPLMRADKMATVLTPYPLYLLLALLSGEWREYVVYHRQATGVERGIIGWSRHMRASWRASFGVPR